MAKLSFLLSLVFLGVLACSSSSNGTASGSGACGISLSWKSSGGACQSWMDAHCCTEEKACAADSACASFIACVNACAVPRTDACLTACGEAPSLVVAAGNCSKQTATDGTSIPNACEWP